MNKQIAPELWTYRNEWYDGGLCDVPYEDWYVIYNKEGDLIAKADKEQDARLIVAVPKMLDTLRILMKAEAMQQGKRDGATMGCISLAIDAAREVLNEIDGECK